MKHLVTSLLCMLLAACSTPSQPPRVPSIVASIPAPAPPAPALPPPAIYDPSDALLKFHTGQAAKIASFSPSDDSSVSPELYKAMRSVRRMAVLVSKTERAVASKHATTDSILDQLHESTIAFNVPESVNVAEKFRIQVILDPKKQVGEVNIEQKGIVVSSKIQVSKIITVKLIAPSFTVVSLSTEEQALAESAPTTWEWDLTPTKPGKQEVKITVDALVQVDDMSANRHITTFDQTVMIDITQQQVIVGWLKQYGQWLWSTILLPIFVFVWKRYVAKKAEE
jgi:hypothetical protein